MDGYLPSVALKLNPEKNWLEMTGFSVAIIGLGSIGIRHARNFRSLGWQVLGFDPDCERQSALIEVGGQARGNRDDTLAEADIAVICSPNAMHLDDAMAAVAADCHILIEKPLAHREAGVEELLEAADVKFLTLALAQNLRYHPAIETAHSWISEGKLGKLLWGRFLCSSYLPNWRPDQDYRLNYTADATTGGVLFDIIHEFDLAHFLMGSGETIAAGAISSGTLDIDAEDCADVIIRHTSGAQSSLHLDYISRNRHRLVEITGTKGFLKIDILGRRLTLTDIDGGIIDEQAFSGSNTDTYRDEITDFVSSIAEGRKPRCSGTEGLAVLRQVLAARQMSGLSQS